MNDPVWPSDSLVSITKSDSTEYLPTLRQIYVGVGGDITVVDQSGETILFKDVPQGMTIGPFFVKKVKSTGTTASSLIGFH